MAAFTQKEIRSFLLSGVIGAEWPKGEAFIWAVVKDEDNKIICQQKYVHQRHKYTHHAEIQFIEDLERDHQGRKLLDQAKKIELFANYSPCDGCAPKLLHLKSNHSKLEIVIKCAFLFNVYHWDENKARENFEGLRSLQAKGIQLHAFSGQDWAQLLTIGFKMYSGYMHRMLVEELEFGDDFIEGREKADSATRNALQECKDGNALATIQQKYERTKDMPLNDPTYKCITLPWDPIQGLKRKRSREQLEDTSKLNEVKKQRSSCK